jgi:hypothetical protein
VGPGALPALAGYLAGQKLLPRWVAHVLTQQPDWFERAFRKQFSKEMRAAASSGSGSKGRASTGSAARSRSPLPPSVDPALLRSFWHPAAASSGSPGDASSLELQGSGSLAAGRGGAEGAAGAGGAAVARPPAPALAPGGVSRYRSDFREEQRLGKGGFGLVVSATNGECGC